MATTLTKLPTVRRVLRGTSGPQPLAGTPQRAADAYAAMCAAAWAESADGPAIPAHDYKPAAPAPGDAYRQTWGYDGDARTERSACGAVCYTVRVPADALTGESCSVTAISADLLGDRYLECGALVTVLGSASPVPPPFAELVEDGDTIGPVLVPDTTIERVNDRPDTSATLVWEPETAPAATAYLHICLRAADYLATRGAWHEGGASLDPASISVTFSRDVSEAGASLPGGAGHGAPCGLGTVVADHSADGAAALRGSYSGAFCCSLRFPTPWDDDLFAPPAFDPADRSHLGMLAAAALVRWRVPEGEGRYAYGHGVSPWGAPLCRLASRQGADVTPGATLADGLFGYRLADGVPVPFALLLCLPVVAPRGLSFSAVRLAGGVQAPAGLAWAVSAWLADAPPPLAEDGSMRHLLSASPDPESLDYAGLADGTARALAMRTASGTSAMALSPLARAVREGAAAGPLDVPAAASVSGRASLVLCLSPVEYDSPGPGDCLASVPLSSIQLA